MSEYHEGQPPHPITRVSPPTSDDEPSIATLTLQLRDVQEQIEAKLKREDTGVHKVNTDNLADAMAAQYAKAGRAAGKNIRNWVLGLIGGLGIPVAAVVGWFLTHLPKPEVEPDDVKAAVEGALEIETKALRNDVENSKTDIATQNQKLQGLTDYAIESRADQAEQASAIMEKIDATSSKARKLGIPESVKAHREKKAEKRRDELRREIWGVPEVPE